MTATRQLALLGGLELALLAAFAWWPAAHRLPWPGLIVFGCAFVAYAAAAVFTARSPAPIDRRVIWLFAIAMRLALLPAVPELSDDIYRYLWDGHVQLSGTNPFAFAPAAEELVDVRTDVHGQINNPDVPTIYPPLAQVAFLLIALAGSSLFVAKAIWLACDLATAYVLVRIAGETGRPESTVLILYAWAPLLVVEVAWSGHLEPLGLLAMSCAIWAAVRAGRGEASAERGQGGAPAGRGRAGAAVVAGGALALATLTKFAPVAALPALARRHGWRPIAAFGLVLLVLYAPYASAGTSLFTGLRTYGEHWWFMKGLFGGLEWLTGDPVLARRLAAVVVTIVVAGTAVARFDLERALLWTLGAGMIITPTLHPWYVLWMLPMAALRRSRAWVLLTGLAFIGYYGLGEYRLSGDWVQPGLARIALWLPFLLLLVIDTRRRAE